MGVWAFRSGMGCSEAICERGTGRRVERREARTTNTPRSRAVKTGLRASLVLLLISTALSGSLARADSGERLTAGLGSPDVTSAEQARRQERREGAEQWAVEDAQAAGAIAGPMRAWQEAQRSCASTCRRCRIVCNADYHGCRDTCSGLSNRQYSLCVDQCKDDRSTCNDRCGD
jgi:hypothetical protein